MSRNAPQAVPTPATPSSINAATATGFTQGDLVFYKGSTGSYVAPSGLTAPSTTQFPYTASAAISGGNSGGIISAVFADPSLSTLGGSVYRFAAVLTNGNIVQVYSKGGIPCFRIVDTSGNTVVSEVVITSTYTMSYDSIGVVALTGGGFAAYWLNTSGGTVNVPNYAVYSNTGSVVTGATNESSAVASAGAFAMNGVALSGGGFALVYFTSTRATWYRGYSAAGVGAYAWTNGAMTANSGTALPAMTARNDNSFVLFVFTTNYQWRVINSSGGTIATGGLSTTSYYNTIDASVLSDGQTVVFSYLTSSPASTYYVAFSILSSSNVFGAEIGSAPTTNQNTSGSTTSRATWISVIGLSSGTNFMLMWPDAFGQAQYAFYNSSGTAISGTNTNGTVPKQLMGMASMLYSRVSLVEFGGKVTAYWRTANYGNMAVNMLTAAISTSTYAPIASSSTSQQLATVTSATGSIYNAGVTPSKAQYYAATTETLPVSISTRYTLNPTSVVATTCDCVSSTTLPNGQFLIAYRNASTYAISVAVYSITGSYVQTISVGTGAATGTGATVSMRIVGLSSGKFAIAYYSTTTEITTAIYSSAFTLISSAATITAVSTLSNNAGISLAALTTDRFVIAYVQSTTKASVISSANAIIFTASPGSSGNTDPCVSADKLGGFGLSWREGGSAVWSHYFYYQYSSTGYSNAGGINVGGDFTYTGAQNCCEPGGGYIIPNFSSTTNVSFYAYDQFGVSFAPYSNVQTVATTNNYALGLTGSGSVVFANLTTSTATLTNIWPQITTANGTSMASTLPSANTFTLTGYSGKSTNTCPSLSPSYGDNVILAWLDSAAFPTFAIISITPTASSVTVTSGVTVSNNIPIVPYTSSSSNTITNSVLAGVAANTAAAGSVGVVQTNGQAVLNSNYSASTASQAFDHQSPNGTGISGVKGTIYGRNIIMQGNN